MLRFGRRQFPDWNPVVEYEELGGNADQTCPRPCHAPAAQESGVMLKGEAA